MDVLGYSVGEDLEFALLFSVLARGFDHNGLLL